MFKAQNNICSSLSQCCFDCVFSVRLSTDGVFFVKFTPPTVSRNFSRPSTRRGTSGSTRPAAAYPAIWLQPTAITPTGYATPITATRRSLLTTDGGGGVAVGGATADTVSSLRRPIFRTSTGPEVVAFRTNYIRRCRAIWRPTLVRHVTQTI